MGWLVVLVLATGAEAARAAEAVKLRPPAVPLVAHDPYFSIWSAADRLSDAGTMHWTGRPHPLRSLVRVDGKAYRLMGTDPADLPAFPQTDVAVQPTRTIVPSADLQVTLGLTFLTPARPTDLEALAWPVTYVVWEVWANDDRPHYAQLCSLAFRQTWAGNKIAADANGMPLVFPKENFSNGCISTVDVLFPQSPFFLLLSPALAKGMLVPVLDYAAPPAWPYPYAPHDLGTYPHATGQVYGMGGDDGRMPVEERCAGRSASRTTRNATARSPGAARPNGRKWPRTTAARGWPIICQGRGA